jgi:hypothetical protein
VWREPLVWAAADSFDLVPGAALPLALYRERSVSREAALTALNDNELTWEIVYTSPSLTGVRAAALAGPRRHPASRQRADRGPAHSRVGRRAAAASRPRIRDLRQAAARQGRRGAGRGSADACTGTVATGDLKMKRQFRDYSLTGHDADMPRSTQMTKSGRQERRERPARCARLCIYRVSYRHNYNF